MRESMENADIFARVWQRPEYFIAFGFGSGLSTVAPGTMGTLAAIPLYLAVSKLALPLYLVIVAIFYVLGVYVCERVSRDLGENDYSGIVWDEIVGYLLTMAFVPMSLSALLLGFVLFRVFDIIKPPPIRQIEARVGGGQGVMLDDVLAAIPAGLILVVVSSIITL